MININILDKAISFFSPQRGYYREVWRQSSEMLKSYDAGVDDRLNAGWRVSDTFAEHTDSIYRDKIRGRARDLERNSDMFESVVKAFVRNIVGSGFQVQAKTGDEELNDEIENLWKQWCKPKNCDVTGTQSFNEILRMCIRREIVDGGILIVKRYLHGGIVPFRLQVFEVDVLDTAISSSKKRVVGGIEYNNYNKPLAYYFKKFDINGIYSGESERIEAKDVIFLKDKKRPSQLREMSRMAPSMTRIKDTNSYMEAVSVKERVAACLSVFVRKAQPSNATYGRSGLSAGAKINTNYSAKKLSPGMISELQPGEDVTVVNPANQGANAADFIRIQERLFGAGQGLSYEAVSRDMSQVNYSSARQGLIEDNKTYQEEQQALIDTVLSEIYESFLISAILSQKLIIKDFWNNKEKYMDHYWTPPGQQWIDPLKEANANVKALESNQTTLSEICAAKGQDWREVIQQRAIEKELMRELGVTGDDINKSK